eukprot:CAMPEP_0184356104 /NCGR_PEP_ID=MMETSP1089-20130417/100812_1 /TAXON_ID=38269 ORGANISM="Gloeochaete wittrockiana, Strain SAG46.84" /NCGR_SAMPLE_ID=MMETSP1089 /ASSEMBLY_ACC=CAM_ASM_000445 /LENGTH=81 /DNA_ID=CAMNT_0026693171 /DNA_START=128 /DNA_END=370 /DNA_ORIENTATION=+
MVFHIFSNRKASGAVADVPSDMDLERQAAEVKRAWDVEATLAGFPPAASTAPFPRPPGPEFHEEAFIPVSLARDKIQEVVA